MKRSELGVTGVFGGLGQESIYRAYPEGEVTPFADLSIFRDLHIHCLERDIEPPGGKAGSEPALGLFLPRCKSSQRRVLIVIGPISRGLWTKGFGTLRRHLQQCAFHRHQHLVRSIRDRLKTDKDHHDITTVDRL